MVKVLFDHNMPPFMARALHEVILLDGHEAIALRDKFPPTISDIEMFKALGRDWIVVSKDVAQARRKPERQAILQSNVVAFYIAPAVEKLLPIQQLATILWHWEAMLRQRNVMANGLFLLPINKGSKLSSL